MKLKKPKFWDFQEPNFLSYLLLPFTLPIIINNFFLGLKKKNAANSTTRTICIGNIYLGGTAKTPLTIKIYQILNNLNIKTATIKKFYKDHVDEQMMLNNETRLYCYKKRMTALNKVVEDRIQIALFDDGLQDRSMNYDLKFVCFNNKKWIGNGFLIPAGPMRERIRSISKYDAVFLNGDEKDNSHLKLIIKKFDKKIYIFESYYRPININQFDTSKKYIIFSGIGNPENFKELLIKNKLNIVKEIIFPDHYNYTQKDINEINLYAKKLDAQIITTEKDYIKIDSSKNKNIKFLKIELIIKNQDKLINFLNKYI